MTRQNYFSSQIVSDILTNSFFSEDPIKKVDICTDHHLEKVFLSFGRKLTDAERMTIEYWSKSRYSFFKDAYFFFIQTLKNQNYFFIIPKFYEDLSLLGETESLGRYLDQVLCKNNLVNLKTSSIAFYPKDHPTDPKTVTKFLKATDQLNKKTMKEFLKQIKN